MFDFVLFSVPVFAQSAGILLREGLEALLIIGALAMFLRKAKAAQRLPILYLGAGVGVLASVVGGWVFLRYFHGLHNDALEAVVLLLASALMLYVSGWLFLRQDPRVWQAFLKKHAEKALAARSVLPLVGLSFLAVFREGAETVLFLHALATSEGGWDVSLLSGLGMAAMGLMALFYFMQVISARLPLRPVFLVTSGFLFLMSLKFIGNAVSELQELQILSYHDLPFGLTWEMSGEQLVAQLLVICVAAGSVLWLRALALRGALARL